MQKQAPSIGRILVAALFALSCFGIALFLWIAFGGPTPLKPESYRFTAYFPEASQLAQESDVRIGGVSVGTVKEISLAPQDKRVNGSDTTEAVIELEPKFAPISKDARATLRFKTLLGETYIELTSGSPDRGDATPVSLGSAAKAASNAEAEAVEPLPEGGTLGTGRVEEQTQIDEIFNALDEETRASFRRWQENAAIAIDGRGLDLSDGFGNLGPFVGDFAEVAEILDSQNEALQGLVRDTGIVFDALTARGQELAGVIEGSNDTFEALEREERALAETFRIFPTFERETRATFARLDSFQEDATPLVRELGPVARELTPTLRSVRELAPHLRDFFPRLDRLQDVSQDGLPALRDTLNGLAPLLEELDPFLANLNPVIRYLELMKATVTDFMVVPGAGLSGAQSAQPGDPAPRHYLRQLSHLSAETLSIWPNRLPTNRGNAYKAPDALSNFSAASKGIFGQFDCKNTDFTPFETAVAPGDEVGTEHEIFDSPDFGTQTNPDVHGGQPPDEGFAPCWVQGDVWTDGEFGGFGDGRGPQLFRDP